MDLMESEFPETFLPHGIAEAATGAANEILHEDRALRALEANDGRTPLSLPAFFLRVPRAA